MKKIGEILNSKKPPQVAPESFNALRRRPSVRRARLVIDNEYLEKGYAALFPNSTTLIYCVLARRAHHTKQTCYPSAEDIIRLCGIKNRQTIFDAFKILEAFGLIAIRHSKGRVSNFYVLLDVSEWKDPNSIKIETVLAQKRVRATVSKSEGQPSQKDPANSAADDTRSHITDSYKEITTEKVEKEENANAENPLGRMNDAGRFMLRGYYSESDMVAAVAEIPDDGEKLTTGQVVSVLNRRGVAPLKELPSFLRGQSP